MQAIFETITQITISSQVILQMVFRHFHPINDSTEAKSISLKLIFRSYSGAKAKRMTVLNILPSILPSSLPPAVSTFLQFIEPNLNASNPGFDLFINTMLTIYLAALPPVQWPANYGPIAEQKYGKYNEERWLNCLRGQSTKISKLSPELIQPTDVE